MIFAIDFDGTIVDHAYPEIGELHEEAFNFISDLVRDGHEWTLLTMREGTKLKEALDFLELHGLKPNYVNDNPPDIKRDFGCNPRKIFAHAYIDDRNAFTYDLQILFFRQFYNIKGGK